MIEFNLRLLSFLQSLGSFKIPAPSLVIGLSGEQTLIGSYLWIHYNSSCWDKLRCELDSKLMSNRHFYHSGHFKSSRSSMAGTHNKNQILYYIAPSFRCG